MRTSWTLGLLVSALLAGPSHAQQPPEHTLEIYDVVDLLEGWNDGSYGCVVDLTSPPCEDLTALRPLCSPDELLAHLDDALDASEESSLELHRGQLIAFQTDDGHTRLRQLLRAFRHHNWTLQPRIRLEIHTVARTPDADAPLETDEEFETLRAQADDAASRVVCQGSWSCTEPDPAEPHRHWRAECEDETVTLEFAEDDTTWTAHLDRWTAVVRDDQILIVRATYTE